MGRATNVVERPCLACGATLRQAAHARPHCPTAECREAYAIIQYAAYTEPAKDGCLNWTGPWRGFAGRTPAVVTSDRSVKSNRREYRAVDIGRLITMGAEMDSTIRYAKTCDNPLCVAPSHHEVVRRQANAPSAQFQIRALLPAAPLLVLAERRAQECKALQSMGYDNEQASDPRRVALAMSDAVAGALKKARTDGALTVTAADLICCDYLHVHPYEVWGELYFTAGEEMADAS